MQRRKDGGTRERPQGPARSVHGDGPELAIVAGPEERTAALARAAYALLAAADIAEVAEVVIDQIRSVIGAAGADFALVDESDNSLIPIRRVGFSPEMEARYTSYPAGDETPVGRMFGKGAALQWNADEFVAEFPTLAGLINEDGFRGMTVVPLAVKDRPIGGIAAAFKTDEPPTFEEMAFLDALASAAAAAIERLRALESARRRTNEAEALARAARGLMDAGSFPEVGELAWREAGTLLGATYGALYLVDWPGRELVLVGTPGMSAGLQAAARHLPLSLNTGVTECVLAGDAVVVETAEEYRIRFPESASNVYGQAGESVPGGMMAIPLRAGTQITGALAFGFAAARMFSERDVWLAQSFADGAASAVERLRANEAVRRRTGEAEALARVTRALMDAGSFEEVGELAWSEAAALLGATRGAFYLVDWVAREMVLVGRPGLSTGLQAVARRVPLSFRIAVTECVLTGDAVLVESSDEYRTRYPESLAGIYGKAGEGAPAGTLAIPLKSHARVIGSLSFGFATSRKFSERDVWLAASFADGAASAIERLRLLTAEQAARKHSSALARASSALFEAEDPAGVGRIVLDEARAVTGAATGSITLLDPADETIYAIAAFGEAGSTFPATVRRPTSESSVVGDVIRTGETVVIEGTEAYAERYPEFAEMVRRTLCRVVLGVPLLVRGRTIGAFSLAYGDRDRIEPHELALLESIGTTAAEAIDRLRAHRLLEAVLAQMPVGVALFDPRGRLTALNERVTELWRGDAPAASLGDWSAWRGFHPDGRPFATDEWPIWSSLQSGELTMGLTIEIERFDGTPGTLEYSSAPMRDEHGSVIGGVVVMSDASGRVEAERAREAFMAVLSHELRTPITSILLAATQLREKGESMFPETRRELFADVEAEAERLNRVVGNLLVLSRVERGAMLTPSEPVLLQHLLPDMIAAEQKLWPGVEFTFVSPPRLPMVQAEPGYLEQVLRNLLANGAKYGGKNVEVSAVPLAGELEIRVRDWGAGIEPEDSLKIFDLFYRSPHMKQSSVGAGIGLFVVKNLVEAMGGRVRVEEPDGPGACFVVSLPIVAGEAT